LFSSGTLQSLENPYEILKKLNDINVGTIALTRNSFSKKTKYISQMSYLFLNGAGNIPVNFNNHIILYPHTAIEEQKLLESLSNFKIAFSSDGDETGVLKDTYSKDILLTRVIN